MREWLSQVRGAAEEWPKKMLPIILFLFKVFFTVCAVLTAVLSIPFLLDALYGTGFPGKMYNNHFSADSWFSFLGSYLPATLIGILTIYQQYVIREKDRQYQELLNRYAYVPDQGAKVYRYSEYSKRIGQLTSFDLQASFKVEDANIIGQWQRGYVLECYVHNVGSIGIKSIDCCSIEWIIKDNRVIVSEAENSIKTNCNNTGEARHMVQVYWQFAEKDKEFANEIITLMNNWHRKDPDYHSSILLLKMKVINQEDKAIDLIMKFKLQCPENGNQYELQSSEAQYFPERRKI